MNEIKVTILVAMYNVEKYLQRFFDSIFNQTMREFNVVIVDDGSTDRSFAICQEFAQSDRRIRLYHKPNGGVSSARNYCLRKLKEEGGGEYCIFADPDDYLEPNMVECLYERITSSDADMLICDYFSDSISGVNRNPCNPRSTYANDVINELLLGMHAGLWNKLVKSSYYVDVKFPDNLNYQEDFFSLIALLLKIEKVDYLPIPLYHYCFHKESLSNNNSSKFVLDSSMNLLRQLRTHYSFLLKNWRYSVYEIRLAYSILIQCEIEDDYFRSFFSWIKMSVLLHPHKLYRRSLFVLLVVKNICSQNIIRKLSHSFHR